MARLLGTACGVRVVGVTEGEEPRSLAVEWAQRTAVEQGFPAVIEDPDALERIATLLWEGRDEDGPGQTRHAGRTRPASKRLRPRSPGPMVM
jgi:hypothetical protein